MFDNVHTSLYYLPPPSDDAVKQRMARVQQCIDKMGDKYVFAKTVSRVRARGTVGNTKAKRS